MGIYLILFSSVWFGSIFHAYGQKEEDIKIHFEDIEMDSTAEETPSNQLICIVEYPAHFEGGHDLFYEIVENNMNFTKTMKEGRVFIQFVVDTTGKMSEIKVVKGLSEENDQEALRLMKLMSQHYKWKPAEQRGIKIKCRMTMPILFKRKLKKAFKEKRFYEH